MQRFNNRGDTLQWAASVSLSPQEVQEVKDQSIREIVSKSVRTQVLNALKNFNDIELLQVAFAAGFLKKPIQQHCKLDGAVWYNEKEGPPCCCSEEDELVDPFHIIWLPLTGQGSNFNHIIMRSSALEVWSTRRFFVCVLAWTKHSIFDPQ